MSNRKEFYRNSEGYHDPTASAVLDKEDEDEARFHKLLYVIFDICELADFKIEGRIVLRDKKTGKIWR